MRIIRIVTRRLHSLLRPSRSESELQQEIELHIQQLTNAGIAAGLTHAQARAAALREFGPVEQTKEQCRDTRRVGWIQDLGQDLRYAVRMLRESPAFTTVAVLTLALGIGANTAIFSIVDAVLLRALPYPDPDQLVLMFNFPVKRPEALSGISYRDFQEFRKQNEVFSATAGNAFHDLTLTGAGDPFVVNTAAVTPELFGLLNTTPMLGRTLLPDDGKPGAPPVAVLSEDLWRTRFGANPHLLGHPVALDMRAFTIVGILPADFRYPEGAPPQDVFIPVLQDPLYGPMTAQPRVRLLGVLGRLKPGITVEKAQAAMDTLAARLANEYPVQDSGIAIRVEPYRKAVVGNVRSPLLILLGAVALVLLMACANLANLLLSRAAPRAREIAVRSALGASRMRLVRQLLTESALLGLLGGVAGLLVAALAIRSFPPLLPPDLARIGSLHLEAPVLLFALFLSFACAIAFGLAPALLATSTNLQARIKEGGERSGQGRGQRARSLLAIAEVSLAMVLLVGGGLLIRSFSLVTAVNPGFDPENVTEAEVSLPQFQYSKPEQWTAFADALMVRLHAQPGLRDSALAAPLPMDHQGQANFEFTIVGDPPLSPGKTNTADYATVSPDYFRVLRIPLLRGRLFSEMDSPSNPKVVIISETLARRYFPDQNPIGRQMKFGFPPHGDVMREIVGVTGDVRDEALSRKPGPLMYVPFSQAPLYGGEVVVRTSLGVAAAATGIRDAVHAIDPNLPVTGVESFPEALGQSVARERFRTLLLGSFSAMALVLAAVGIFGVISCSAAQRRREIGIRMAVGAQRREILSLILSEGAKLALCGLAIGAVFALLLTRLMASLLYEVSAWDPLTFGAVAILLFSVAVIACYIPARRAMRVDPMVALRYD